MTKFSFICPVCKIGVNGRNFRRHTRRVHGHVTEPGVERFARRRMKDYRRDPENWERTQVWSRLRESALVIKFGASGAKGAWLIQLAQMAFGAPF